MKKNKPSKPLFNDPLAAYNFNVGDMVNSFDLATRKGFKQDVMVRPESYGRVGVHLPTNTLLVATSKTEANLRGNTLPNGREQATKDGIEAAYVIGAFKSKSDVSEILKEDGRDFRTNAALTYDAFRGYCGQLKDNAQNQYSLLGFSHAGTEVFTNRDIVYTIAPQGNHHKISYMAPIGDGNSITELEGNNSVWRYGAVSRTLDVVDSKNAAREVVNKHWEALSSDLWDEVDGAKYKGLGFKTRRAEAANAMADHSLSTAVISAVFGVGGYALDPSLGPLAAGVGAFGSSAGHVILSSNIGTIEERYSGHQEKKERYNLESYDYGENAIDYFLTESEIGKMAPKLDTSRIDPLEIEWLTADEMGWMQYDGIGVLNSALSKDPLAKDLVRAPNLGMSSEGGVAKGLILSRYQTGMVHLMQQHPENGMLTIYGQYRADVCRVKGKKMPPESRRLMGSEITRVDINPRTKEFVRSAISYEDAVEEIAEGISPLLNNKSKESVVTGASESFFDSTEKRVRISKKHPETFELEALVPPDPE